jgi:hypothetical protein
MVASTPLALLQGCARHRERGHPGAIRDIRDIAIVWHTLHAAKRHHDRKRRLLATRALSDPVVARRSSLSRETEGSNPSPSTGESGTNRVLRARLLAARSTEPPHSPPTPIPSQRCARCRRARYQSPRCSGGRAGPDDAARRPRRRIAGGEIAGAALDVFDQEPLPAEHPLWTTPGVLLTPHTAGYGPYLDERRYEIILDNCRRFLAGQPLRNLVDKARWF